MKNTHLVAGAGLQGLACAFTLVSAGEDVIIIEAKQEIGNPVNGIGYINQKSTYDWICKMNPPTQLQLQDNQGEWGLRLEWLEKLLCQRIGEFGADIRVKTRILGWKENCEFEVIEVKGTGADNSQFISAKYFHDCLGDQPFTNALPGLDGLIDPNDGKNVLGRKIRSDLIQWSGAIASPKRIPQQWSHLGWDGKRLAFPRADGTVECWMKGTSCKPQHPNGWLEIISIKGGGDHHELSIDTAVSRAINQATKFLKQQ